MIATDLSKQNPFNSVPKAIQQIHFNGDLERQATMFFIIEERKETVLDFSQGNEKGF